MTSGPIDIVPLEARHLRALMAIDKQVYPEPWSRTLWKRELARDRSTRVYLAALHGGEVVGYAGALRIADETHVVTVAVDPALQRGGVGRQLFARLCDTAIDWGCTGITLEVRADNTAAQALYRRFGLVPVGVRKGYYEPDRQDALIMWAHDVDGADFAERLARARAAGPLTTDQRRTA